MDNEQFQTLKAKMETRRLAERKREAPIQSPETRKALDLDPKSAVLVKDNGSQRIYQVQSQSDPRTKYTVYATDHHQQCTCPHAVFRQGKCKHSELIRLMEGAAIHDIENGAWAWQDLNMSDAQEFEDWRARFKQFDRRK